MAIVADTYDLVIGVDTHAASHTFAVVAAATVLLTWSHPGRIHSEAAFATLAGAAPLPSTRDRGNTNRHRLNRGGD